MTGDGLRRAGPADRDAVVALQHAAYAPNRALLGVEPLPLLADYDAVFANSEVWVPAEGPIDAVLILEPAPDHLLIWSVATAPGTQGRGLGGRLLAFAEARARALGPTTIRLYTGAKLAGNVAWYQRNGYAIERVEALADRDIVHFVKHLDPAA